MSRLVPSGPSTPGVHVKSTRGPGPFDWVEAQRIYPIIRAGLAAGESNLTIARRAGVSDTTVSRYRKRARA